MSEIRCPICKKPTRPSEPHFPFCSKRCKMVDLGAWLEGRYRISRPLGQGENAAPASGTAGAESQDESEEEAEPSSRGCQGEDESPGGLAARGENIVTGGPSRKEDPARPKRRGLTR